MARTLMTAAITAAMLAAGTVPTATTAHDWHDGYDRGGYDRGGYDRGSYDRGYDHRDDGRGGYGWRGDDHRGGPDRACAAGAEPAGATCAQTGTPDSIVPARSRAPLRAKV